MDNKDVLVSIIIPIYNCENYLSRCLDSIFNQTIIDDCEVILINDCSTDNSYSILQEKIKEYEERVNNIIVINHEKNKKIGYTRKEGILKASGNYIAQIDSDDWIELNMIEELYKEAYKMDADIVNCDLDFVYKKHRVVSKQKTSLIPYEAMKQIVVGEIGGFFCNKLIRRALFTEEMLNQLEKTNMWEDSMICIPLYYESHNLSYVDNCLYHYDRTNLNSLCATISSNSIEQLCFVADFVVSFFKKNNISEDLGNIFKARIKVFFLPQISINLQKEYRYIFPEVNTIIYKIDTIPVYYRIIINMLCKKFYFGVFLNLILKFIRRIRNRMK